MNQQTFYSRSSENAIKLNGEMGGSWKKDSVTNITVYLKKGKGNSEDRNSMGRNEATSTNDTSFFGASLHSGMRK